MTKKKLYYSSHSQYARHGFSRLATVAWTAKRDASRNANVTICRGQGDSVYGGNYAAVDIIAYVTPQAIEFTHNATKREIDQIRKGE